MSQYIKAVTPIYCLQPERRDIVHMKNDSSKISKMNHHLPSSNGVLSSTNRLHIFGRGRHIGFPFPCVSIRRAWLVAFFGSVLHHHFLRLTSRHELLHSLPPSCVNACLFIDGILYDSFLFQRKHWKCRILRLYILLNNEMSIVSYHYAVIKKIIF